MRSTVVTEPARSDDYSYDLAHEVHAVRTPDPRRPGPPSAPSARTGRAADPDGGDLGYDDAHDAAGS
jgi:hypothetical protein